MGAAGVGVRGLRPTRDAAPPPPAVPPPSPSAALPGGRFRVGRKAAALGVALFAEGQCAVRALFTGNGSQAEWAL